MKPPKKHRISSVLIVIGISILMLGVSNIYSASVALGNTPATYSQYDQSHGWPFSVDTPINGSATDGLAWPVAHYTTDLGGNGGTCAETAANISFTNGSIFTFRLVQAYGARHTTARFRLSVTTDDRITLADGLTIEDDVTASWTVSEDSVLPFNEPGWNPGNGNLLLSEFSMDLATVSDLCTYTADEVCRPSKTRHIKFNGPRPLSLQTGSISTFPSWQPTLTPAFWIPREGKLNDTIGYGRLFP